jgi:hypothetical protein
VSIAAYTSSLPAAQAAICRKFRQAIHSALPKATAKIWHGSPVWFVGENPVVGYSVKKRGVALLFWNGQAFAEPALTPLGSFKAAEVVYANAAVIDEKALARWLRRARTDVYDSTGMFRKALAKRKRAKKK